MFTIRGDEQHVVVHLGVVAATVPVMFNLGAMLARLAGAVRTAWADEAFRGAAVGLLLLMATATVFYTSQEHWSVVEAVYFAVCTGLTIGYGDLHPSTTASKLFTVVYALLTVGLFVSLAAMLADAHLARGRQRRDRLTKRRNEKRRKGQGETGRPKP